MFDLALVPVHESASIGEAEVVLTLKNNCEKNYLVSRDSVMLDGFLNNKFTIVDELGNKVKYQGITAKYIPEYVILESGNELKNTLNLASAYNFDFGHYDLSYSTPLMYCEYTGHNGCLKPEIDTLSTSVLSIDIT